MPKVSIIIPFNNVESYISECLDSVLNQTLKDIEVIMVNDASTDKSRDIAAKYMQKDSRIKILDFEERKGQGFARNRAIETAKGEYIGFVDSDDFIEPDMFELLYNSAKSNDTDISMCQVREYDDINEEYITSDYYSLADLSCFGENIFSAQDTKKQILDINVALWNKIYKREYLNKIGEKFPEGFIYEDLPFFFGTYLPAKRIQIVWKNLYSYRVNRKNSTMQQFNSKILDRPPMVSLTYEKLKAAPYLCDMKQKIQGWIINDLFHRYTLLKENYHKEFFFLMKKVFENLEIDNIDDAYWSKVYHFQGYLLVVNNSFEEFNQKVFNEYLDIHKVEDRLRSEMVNTEEIDKRFNLIYSDLEKNYAYANLLADESKKQIQEYKSKLFEKINDITTQNAKKIIDAAAGTVVQVTTETDNKIELVYSEITKNYKYTEELAERANSETQAVKTEIQSFKNICINDKNELYKAISDNKNLITQETDNKISVIYNELSGSYNASQSETDSKISKVYDEITKNYKYTEELIEETKNKFNEEITKNYKYTEELILNLRNNLELQIKGNQENLYNDIKDLSFVVQDNFVELNKEQDFIKEQNKRLINEINNAIQKNQEQIAYLKNEYQQYINSKMQEFSRLLNQTGDEIDKYLQNIQNEAAIEKQNNQAALENLKSEFMDILQQQQQRHDEEIINLKNQMYKMEADLKEEMKSPFRKFIEKCKTKPEK